MAYRIATTTRKRFYLRRNVRAGTRTLVALDLRIPAPETADPRAGLGTDRTQGNELPRTLPAGRLAPGAAELLDWLCEHDIPHTIATASEIRNVRFFREHFGLDRWFDPRRIVYDDGTFSGKPAPDIYLRAAERIGLSPSRCIVAEDARSGIEAARRAGAGMIVAVASTMDRGTVGRSEGVDVVIDRLDRLDRNLFVQYPKA